jgi:hypothetical protein
VEHREELEKLIRSLIREEISVQENFLMRTKEFMGGAWDDAFKMGVEAVFGDMGVEKLEAKKGESGSVIDLTLQNGDHVQAITMNNPLSGQITINGEHKTRISGSQVLHLLPTMRKVLDAFRGATA